jgi:hypothetical protein
LPLGGGGGGGGGDGHVEAEGPQLAEVTADLAVAGGGAGRRVSQRPQMKPRLKAKIKNSKDEESSERKRAMRSPGHDPQIRG